MSATEMEETLQQLFEVVDKLGAEPSNVALLRRNVELAKKAQMVQEAAAGLEMLANNVGCPIVVWREVLSNISVELPYMSVQRAHDVAALLRKALADYASTEIAAKVGEILSHLHPIASTVTPLDHPMDGEDSTHVVLLDEDTTRDLWKATISISERIMSEKPDLWEAYIAWEEGAALAKIGDERTAALTALKGRYIAHLAVPHNYLAETAGRYSTFNTAHFLEEYEPNMVKASNMSAKSSSKFQARETWEDGWQTLSKEIDDSAVVTDPSWSSRSLAYLSAWLDMEISLPDQGVKGKGKGRAREADAPKLEPFFVIMVFERMLQATSYNQERVDKLGEAVIWLKYYRFMQTTNGIAKAEATTVLKRAARCCPESGEIWATLMRHQEVLRCDASEITSTYTQAHSLGLLTQSLHGNLRAGEVHPVEELVILEMAWCGFIRRMGEAKVTSSEEDRNDQSDLIEITIRESIERLRALHSKGDSNSRLELYLINWLERRGQVEEATQIWEQICKARPKDYQAWVDHVDFLIRHNQISQARSAYKIAANRQGMDWPQAIWSRWISFEERYGTIEQLSAAHLKVAGLSDALAKRMAETAAAFIEVPPTELVRDQLTTTVEESEKLPSANKRKTDAANLSQADDETVKRAKHEQTVIEATDTIPPRDREFATVLVANLPEDVTEDLIRQRFEDCGAIREVTISNKNGSLTASVEFVDREDIPAALTKDKKKIGESEIHVYQAGQTTLFVTNFPEKMDDAAIRHLFSQYGEMMDPRWPSRKYKDSRRFCYVQFLTTASAHAACELNGRELEPGLAISVLISDPERKKQRSDANSDQRELYITGLSKFVAEKDLRRLFGDFGEIKRVSLATDEEGHCKGFAFVEFGDETAVSSALAMDGTQLKKRTMKVDRVDPAAKSKKNAGDKHFGNRQPDTEELSRSVRLTGLPAKTQEGLLQQALEKVARIKKVEVFIDLNEALVEFTSAADVGTMLLQGAQFDFAGHTLEIVPLGKRSDLPKPSKEIKSTPVDAAAMAAPAPIMKPRPPKAANRKRSSLSHQLK